MNPLNGFSSHTASSASFASNPPLKVWSGLADMASSMKLNSWNPSVDLYEEEGSFIARFEMPGVSKSSVEVDLFQNGVLVSGQKNGLGDGVDVQDFSDSGEAVSFKRQVLFPDSIDADTAEVIHQNGVLTVRAPKIDSAPLKRISVQFLD